jgi:hypothetical protein
MTKTPGEDFSKRGFYLYGEDLLYIRNVQRLDRPMGHPEMLKFDAIYLQAVSYANAFLSKRGYNTATGVVYTEEEFNSEFKYLGDSEMTKVLFIDE